MSGLGGGATTAGAGGKAEHGGSVEGGEITAHQVQAGGEDDQACWGGGGRFTWFGLEKDIPFSPNLTCYAAGSNTGSYCISPMYVYYKI